MPTVALNPCIPQVLLSAGKKGAVCIFDVRQRTLRHRFQAHESAIKCMALDQSEEFFVTGAVDGDIKVSAWRLKLIYKMSSRKRTRVLCLIAVFPNYVFSRT